MIYFIMFRWEARDCWDFRKEMCAMNYRALIEICITQGTTQTNINKTCIFVRLLRTALSVIFFQSNCYSLQFYCFIWFLIFWEEG